MNRENNDLVNLLRTQLSEAINLQNKDTIAQLHEALRCVRQFDSEGYVRLGFNAKYILWGWIVFLSIECMLNPSITITNSCYFIKKDVSLAEINIAFKSLNFLEI